jgi:hypothetical protein
MLIPEPIRTERGMVVGYTSFDQAVRGQIERRKLRVNNEEIVVRLAPVIEQELSNAGFVYEHFGLNKTAKEVLALYTFNGQRVRVGVGSHWKGSNLPPLLWVDGWADTEFGNRTQFSKTFELADDVTALDVATFCQSLRAAMISFGC